MWDRSAAGLSGAVTRGRPLPTGAAVAYLSAWLVAGLSYFATFRSFYDVGIWLQVRDAAVNCVTGAALGLVVLTCCRRLEWLTPGPLTFFLAHAIGAVSFSLAWWMALSFGFMLTRWLDGAQFAFVPWRWNSPAFYWQMMQGVAVYFVIAGLCYAFQVGRRWREEEARATRADALRSRAELAALRAQLNPHFLFNTLHSLHALVRRDPSLAEEGMERLGDMLRYALAMEGDGADDVPLEAEWRFVMDYLAIERMRLGSRLRVDARLDASAAHAAVPPLTVQPLVENAIKHAISRRVEGGTLRVSATASAGRLLIEVKDEGPGAAPTSIPFESPGVGLTLVRRRIEERFGDEASMEAGPHASGGYRVRLDLPLEPRP